MRNIHRVALAVSSVFGLCALSARADGDMQRVNHVIIVMQENHSFDNYFGVLPYVPQGPYHAGPCARNDHRCVDGLTCHPHGTGLRCKNSNLDADTPQTQRKVHSFNLANYCVAPDLDHEWPGSHQEANFDNPRHTLGSSPNDGFVRVNDSLPWQKDTAENATEDETMGYYDQADLPFYYGLAQTFAISDRYFSSILGPTFPNRAYGLAATSFGHLTTLEILPPTPVGYKPIKGTILDLLDHNGVSWKNFFSDLPTTGIFRGLDPAPTGHQWPVAFLSAFAPQKPPSAPPNPNFCGLPAVSFIDPNFGFSDLPAENDEHPPSSIKKGESFVSRIINLLRGSYCWDDSVIFITYDEHGGFYDHVAPPRAPQGGAKNPDGIDPGLCADQFGPVPGTGQNCVVSRHDANTLCPDFAAAGPTGPYPASCPNFDQLGFRVPFMAVSPFSKPQYVSHRVADHTSMLAFIEKRFLSTAPGPDCDDGDDREDDERGDRRGACSSRLHLTLRDQFASTLEDLFDFDAAPSSSSPVPQPEDDARCQQ